jgi:hypothetical protein
VNTNPENHEELTRLISALLDGSLIDDEQLRLEALLQTDPQARRLYMQMIDQEIELPLLLRTEVQGKPAGRILPLTEPPQGTPRPSARRRRPWPLAAAAIVLLMGTALALVLSRNRGGERTADTPVKQIPSSLARATWSEDFESGLAPGWIGTLVSTNLPFGSKHAVTTALRRWPEGDYHTIQLPEDWTKGLFSLTERSTLHISYRFAKGTYVNAFMHTLPADTRDSTPSMFQLRPTQSPRATRRWQTASIPFSQFVRKVEATPGGPPTFVGGPPSVGERVAALAFSSPEEIDFVIDRIWVTPTESSEEVTNQTPNQ